MTFEIFLVFAILALALASFVWEKVPVEVTAISVFGLILALGLLSVDQALTVLANPAPVTLGAMFMVSAGLEKCGAIGIMTGYFKRFANAGYVPFLFVMIFHVRARKSRASAAGRWHNLFDAFFQKTPTGS